jgi:hypothetical protein
MQISAIKQELMDAALTCGDAAREDFNAFQTILGPTLTQSDKQLLSLFRKVLGKGGNAAYNTFKTDLATKAELRRIHGHAAFCTGVAKKAQAVLALPILEGRSTQVQAANLESLQTFAGETATVDFVWPISLCEIPVPDVAPLPNPLRVALASTETQAETQALAPAEAATPPGPPAVAPPANPQ